jgi:hypothetical protein
LDQKADEYIFIVDNKNDLTSNQNVQTDIKRSQQMGAQTLGINYDYGDFKRAYI